MKSGVEMMTRIENFFRNSKFIQKIYNYAPLPLAGTILNLRAIPLVKLRYSKETFEHLDKSIERDGWTNEELEHFVEKQLKNIIEVATKIPYYKDIAKNALSIKDFPVLTREAVRNNYRAMLNPAKDFLMKVFTSGSSGSGLPVFYNNNTYSLNWAYIMKHIIWAKANPRDWRITFFGARVISLKRSKPPFWIKNIFEKQYLVSIFHISDNNAESYVKFLEEHQGMVLEGFPTVLYLIARYANALRIKLNFKAVFSTGEPIYLFMRKEIEEAFNCKVYDSYGMTELCGLIYECEKGGYHVLVDYGYLEILKENGEEAHINEEGYLVWTGFINSAMPFIRYRIGDKGIWEKGRCPCGRPYPLVQPTITRDSDYILTPSGKLLSPRAVNQVLKDKMSFKACQFVQVNDKEIVVRIVPDRTRDFRKDLEEVKRSIRTMSDKEIIISEEIAKEPLRRGSQGKIPLIISKTTLNNLIIK